MLMISICFHVSQAMTLLPSGRDMALGNRKSYFGKLLLLMMLRLGAEPTSETKLQLT